MIDNTQFEDDVLPDIVFDHGSKLVDLGHVPLTEAEGVKSDGVVHVDSSLDTGEEVVAHVEVPGDLGLVDEVWNVGPVVFVGGLVGVKALPEVGALSSDPR